MVQRVRLYPIGCFSLHLTTLRPKSAPSARNLLLKSSTLQRNYTRKTTMTSHSSLPRSTVAQMTLEISVATSAFRTCHLSSSYVPSRTNTTSCGPSGSHRGLSKVSCASLHATITLHIHTDHYHLSYLSSSNHSLKASQLS